MVKIPVTRKVRNHSPMTIVTVMVNNLVYIVCSIEGNFTPIMNNFALYTYFRLLNLYMNVHIHTLEYTGFLGWPSFLG